MISQRAGEYTETTLCEYLLQHTASSQGGVATAVMPDSNQAS